MRCLTTLLAAACVLIAAPPAAARTWTLSQGEVAVKVRTTRTAVVVTTRAFSARIRVGRHGAPAARRDTIHSRFRTPVGKRRRHSLDARVLTLAMTGGRRVDVLVARDGIAMRERNAAAPVYRAPAGSRAWLQRYTSNYEGAYRAVDLAQATGAYGYPALLKAGGTWALLS